MGAHVVFSSVLLVRGKDVRRDRSITGCKSEVSDSGLDFCDHWTLFEDQHLLGRDLTKQGKDIFADRMSDII